MSPELNHRLCEQYPTVLRCLSIDCVDGSYSLIEAVRELGLRASREAPPVALQVQEKFGALSIVIHGGDERTQAYVAFAAFMSESICELCGRPGVLLGNYDGGWARTRCGTYDAEDGTRQGVSLQVAICHQHP